MTDYTKELEANVESLKSALDKERDWVDYMNKRKKSQKYRRWGVKYLITPINIPTVIQKSIPIQHCYAEYITHTLEDMRCIVRYIFDNSVEGYYTIEMPKIHRKSTKILTNVQPRIRVSLEFYLFDQLKNKEVFTRRVTFDVGYYGKKQGVRMSNVIGLEPNQIRELDELILPSLIEDDEYLNKWEKLHPEV